MPREEGFCRSSPWSPLSNAFATSRNPAWTQWPLSKACCQSSTTDSNCHTVDRFGKNPNCWSGIKLLQTQKSRSCLRQLDSGSAVWVFAKAINCMAVAVCCGWLAASFRKRPLCSCRIPRYGKSIWQGWSWATPAKALFPGLRVIFVAGPYVHGWMGLCLMSDQSRQVCLKALSLAPFCLCCSSVIYQRQWKHLAHCTPTTPWFTTQPAWEMGHLHVVSWDRTWLAYAPGHKLAHGIPHLMLPSQMSC